jgi:hypothetical protein
MNVTNSFVMMKTPHLAMKSVRALMTAVLPRFWELFRIFRGKNVLPTDIPPFIGRLRLKCDGTRAETIFRLSAKRLSPFKSAGSSVQSTTGSRGVRISGSNAGYTVFRGSVKSTGYTLNSPVSTSFPLPWVPVCHHFSTGHYSRIIAVQCIRPSHCYSLSHHSQTSEVRWGLYFQWSC